MPTTKTRVTLYLERDLMRRTRELVDSLPGVTFSGLVAELLDGLVAQMGQVVAAARSGNKEAQLEVYEALVGRQMLQVATEGKSFLDAVRQSEKGVRVSPKPKK